MKTLTLLASAALLSSLGMTAYAVAPSLSASSVHMNYIQNAAASTNAAPTSSTPSGATSSSSDDSAAINDDGSDDGSDDTAGDNDGDN